MSPATRKTVGAGMLDLQTLQQAPSPTFQLQHHHLQAAWWNLVFLNPVFQSQLPRLNCRCQQPGRGVIRWQMLPRSFPATWCLQSSWSLEEVRKIRVMVNMSSRTKLIYLIKAFFSGSPKTSTTVDNNTKDLLITALGNAGKKSGITPVLSCSKEDTNSSQAWSSFSEGSPRQGWEEEHSWQGIQDFRGNYYIILSWLNLILVYF